MRLFSKYKKFNEGDLSKKYSYLVQKKFLFKISQELQIEDVLQYNFKKKNNKMLNSIFSDSFTQIPFINHDDLPRVYMGFSLLKQIVPILYGEIPIVDGLTSETDQMNKYIGYINFISSCLFYLEFLTF